MDIGLQIKKFREQQKISQEELALKIFVSRQTISNWETNKSCPDVKSLITLSNILDVYKRQWSHHSQTKPPHILSLS